MIFAARQTAQLGGKTGFARRKPRFSAERFSWIAPQGDLWKEL